MLSDEFCPHPHVLQSPSANCETTPIFDLAFTKYPDDASSANCSSYSERVTTWWFCLSCSFSYMRTNYCLINKEENRNSLRLPLPPTGTITLSLANVKYMWHALKDWVLDLRNRFDPRSSKRTGKGAPPTKSRHQTIAIKLLAPLGNSDYALLSITFALHNSHDSLHVREVNGATMSE